MPRTNVKKHAPQPETNNKATIKNVCTVLLHFLHTKSVVNVTLTCPVHASGEGPFLQDLFVLLNHREQEIVCFSLYLRQKIEEEMMVMSFGQNS